MKLLSSLFIAILLLSCSPQKRLNRLLAHNPELKKIDTVYTHSLDTIKQINEVFKFKFDTLPGDTFIKEVLIPFTKIFYKKVLKDTLTKIQDGITVKVFQNGKEIGVIINRPQEVKETTTSTIIQSVDQHPCEHSPTWYDYICYGLAGLCLIIIVGLIYVK